MISVIIPAYNVGKYIEECIFSLVNQTYKDIEIIIVDDGSTDNTREIIRGFEIEYPYIKCYDQVNSGVSVARNFGLQKATGDYIIFVDPDDYLDEKMLEHMYEKMMENNSDIVICGHNIFYEENPNEYIKNIYNIDDTKTYNNIETINMMLELKVKGYVWDKLFRRINLINHNFKFEEGRYVQDWYPVFREVALAQRISFINKPLYFYRQRKTSTIYKKNKKLIDDYGHAVNKINKFINENDYYINNNSIKVFYLETYYTLIRHYYLYFSTITHHSKLYKDFRNSKYNNIIKFKWKYFVGSKCNIKLKIKILLWKLKVFHIFFK